MTNSSGGPVTENGKAIASRNSTRHGIRSPEPVVPGVEKREDWEAHRDGILENISPVGQLESTLAERVALLSWRLHRVARYETETIGTSQEKLEEDLAERRRFSASIAEGIHPEDVRGTLKHARSLHRLFKRLPKLEDDKRVSGPDADGVLWTAANRADVIAEGEMDIDELLEGISVPGVPEDVGWEEHEGWNAGAVRAGIEAIASATREDPDELIEHATEKARLEIISAKHRAEEVERDLERMSRERLLPNEKTLEKITRYEAHLSRQMFKALHELEALQKHRTGGEAPLARLDVDGLPIGSSEE